ncbi:glycosyltransferase [Aporhodopirellula aestuarii]|uniref:Glycosyltransferase n=1 Tax=Aporhodopirellula aestuarii TaxID=2950107 RepID=A0ABT0TZB0_9BACT|nr:glycosyltransferase [Aporhodopirellula aestuarii]MCM2369947.1 glycosyltransferase [Aporhodopirellula aestuarii]
MKHFGLVCPATTGHLNTILPLGKELRNRGHRVTLFGKLDAEEAVANAGIGFVAIGEAEFPRGSVENALKQLGRLQGRAALAYTVQLFNENASVFLRDAPEVLRRSGVDALIVDQATPEAGSVADYLGIPFVNLCSAAILNRDDLVPSPFTPWHDNPSFLGRLRNRIGYRVTRRLLKPVMRTIDGQRRQWNLPAHVAANDRFSKLAQISQQPAELEFPRTDLPDYFHFTGPFHNNVGRPQTDFPFDRLTDQPLVYASLGTIHGNAKHLFHEIAEACATFDVQLVISLGRSMENEAIPTFPGSPIAVRYAPQLELLKRAALTITHGGMNTTLECLTNAIPMVVIPLANDQPGIGSRVKWSGCGESIPAKSVSVATLRKAISQILHDPSYRENARKMHVAIERCGGVTQAADIVELAASSNRQVCRVPN